MGLGRSRVALSVCSFLVGVCSTWVLFEYSKQSRLLQPIHCSGLLSTDQRYTVENAPQSYNKTKLLVPHTNFKGDPQTDELRSVAHQKYIPDEATMNNYTLQQLSLLYHSYLDNMDVVCKLKIRMGNVGDGGWEICDDPEWRPFAPCIVYSFGINNDFSFDDDTAKVYGCRVYSFDPSMKQESHNRSALVTFLKVGISGASGPTAVGKGTWQMYSFSDIKKMLGHQHDVIDVVKMDVEHSEWPSLTNMIQERQLHEVRQLLVEFHHHQGTERSKKDGVQRLSVLRDLQQIGFRRFLVNKNPACVTTALSYPVKRTQCYEVHFVNANFQRELV